MEDFVIKGNLFELYGGLLKENQRRVYEYHIVDDMSFSEIGEELGITRQAAQELFRRADQRLAESEATLGLEKRMLSIRALAERIQTESSEAEIRRLAGEIIDGI